MRPNHKELITHHLMRKRSITGLEALQEYGCYRLSSVIHRLRKDGFEIETEEVRTDDGGVHARYHYHPQKQEA
jgi:hypothetical protein